MTRKPIEIEPCTVADRGCIAPAGYRTGGGGYIEGDRSARCVCTRCGERVCRMCSVVSKGKRICNNCVHEEALRSKR